MQEHSYMVGPIFSQVPPADATISMVQLNFDRLYIYLFFSLATEHWPTYLASHFVKQEMTEKQVATLERII